MSEAIQNLRANALKRAQLLDAQIVIARRDLSLMEFDHKELLGYLKGFDDAARSLAPAAPEANKPETP